jgi:alpha-D-ribose 1-methylphosphonate 5-triphosphate synthase subunit PhnG
VIIATEFVVIEFSHCASIKLSINIDNLNWAMAMHAETTNLPEQAAIARRRAAMAVLAASDTAAIDARVGALAPPAFTLLREPEQGLVMLRGRIGGDGAAFNVGEATVSRAAVRLASGEVGFGYTLGRDRTKAKLIALCDALLQSADYAAAVEAEVIAPLRTGLEAARAEQAARTAATKVDFYTLVRGEG